MHGLMREGRWEPALYSTLYTLFERRISQEIVKFMIEFSIVKSVFQKFLLLSSQY